LKLPRPSFSLVCYFLVLGVSASAQSSSKILGTQSDEPRSQLFVDDCATEVAGSMDDKASLNFNLVYPASKASYVGGMLPEMDMSEGTLGTIGRLLLLRRRQFRRNGQIAMTRHCLLFAFAANGENLQFDEAANYHVFRCLNDVRLSRKKGNKAGLCQPVLPAPDGKVNPARSYLIAIPYAEVNVLARAKYATSDLTSTSSAYVTAAAALLTTLGSGGLTASTERILGIAAGGMALYYYVGILEPRVEDNYIAVFVKPQAPTITFARDQSNIVTVTTDSPHHFREGQSILVSDVVSSSLQSGLSISEICRLPNGTVVVVTTMPHGLEAGAQVQIAHVTKASFNGEFHVESVISPNIFTYEQKDKPEVGSLYGTGEVKDDWNGTFVIESPVTAKTFSYWQVGPKDTIKGTATVEPAPPGDTTLTISGNLAQDQPGAANPKSTGVTGTVDLSQPPGKSDELFKKGDLLIFRIPNYHDYYNISLTLSGGTGLTFVSETAEKASK
jgi:hypothetical protein